MIEEVTNTMLAREGIEIGTLVRWWYPHTGHHFVSYVHCELGSWYSMPLFQTRKFTEKYIPGY
jgi:hypothetical protein